MIQNFDDFCRELNRCGFSMGGYISSSTRSEIEYAHATDKTVRYLEESQWKFGWQTVKISRKS